MANPKICDNCGKENPLKNKFCINCGHEINNTTKGIISDKGNKTIEEIENNNSNFLAIGFATVTIILIVYGVFFIVSEKNKKYGTKNDTIELSSHKYLNESSTKDSLILKAETQKYYKELEEKHAQKEKLAEQEKRLHQDNKTQKSTSKTKFSFKSTLGDEERNGVIINTYHEVTYHTIDLQNKTVSLTTKSKGKWIKQIYHFDGIYKEEALLATTYVLQVGNNGVIEIWWNSVKGNIGYDLVDGTRLAFYELVDIIE
ncbi:MAG: zinc ribbon domain-containing protein [Chitinophagales bacterium]|nr:zinc ribbon domain-containing protein [Chitinophagales bacterium]